MCKNRVHVVRDATGANSMLSWLLEQTSSEVEGNIRNRASADFEHGKISGNSGLADCTVRTGEEFVFGCALYIKVVLFVCPASSHPDLLFVFLHTCCVKNRKKESTKSNSKAYEDQISPIYQLKYEPHSLSEFSPETVNNLQKIFRIIRNNNGIDFGDVEDKNSINSSILIPLWIFLFTQPF